MVGREEGREGKERKERKGREERQSEERGMGRRKEGGWEGGMGGVVKSVQCGCTCGWKV